MYYGLAGALAVALELDGDGDVEVFMSDQDGDDPEIIQAWLTREEGLHLAAHLTRLFGRSK